METKDYSDGLWTPEETEQSLRRLRFNQTSTKPFPSQKLLQSFLYNILKADYPMAIPGDALMRFIPGPQLLEMFIRCFNAETPKERQHLRKKIAEDLDVYDLWAISPREGLRWNQTILDWLETQDRDLKADPEYQVYSKELSSRFHLNSQELLYLAFLTVTMDDYPVENWRISIGRDSRGIATGLGIPPAEFSSVVEPHNALEELELFTDISTQTLQPALALGIIYMDFGRLTPSALKKDTLPCFDLESFGLHTGEKTTLKALLQNVNPLNILIWGPPGTGKTELARSLIRDVGLKPWIYSREMKADSDSFYKLYGAISVVDPKNEVLIVDEAECFLENFSDGKVSANRKSLINLFLDRTRGKTLWVLNDPSVMDISTLRRFQYIVNLQAPTRQRREKLWAYHTQSQGLENLLPPQIREELSSKYELSSALIQQSLGTLKHLAQQDWTPQQALTNLQQVMQSQVKVGLCKEVPGLTSGAFSLETVNCSPAASEIFQGLKNWQDKTGAPRGAITLLFHGLPGTGKTEMGKQLAQHLDIHLKSVRSSDLIDSFVGATEKNIRSAFETAQEQGDLLMIDEIDSFLYSRERAERSWEISQVNEFLTALEQFQGIFVGTCNSVDRLDPAVLRRFTLKVEFQALSSAQLRPLAQKFFPELDLPEEDDPVWKRLPPLTPGDFALIAKKPWRVDSWGALRQALETEASYRKTASHRPAGFHLG